MQEKTIICARAQDVVAYLYNEATAAEALDFERHTAHCAACRMELATFGEVREAIGEWRQQSLGVLTSPAFETNAASVPAKATVKKSRSALAALREFFTLSPVWMRAATAFAAAVFCVLAFIAVAYFTNQPKVVVIEQPNQTNGVQKDNNPQVVEKNKQQEDQKVKGQPATRQEDVAVNVSKQNPPKPIKRRVVASQQLVATHKKVAPRILNQPPEETVADYLPFTASRPEAKLPTLADLADESN